MNRMSPTGSHPPDSCAAMPQAPDSSNATDNAGNFLLLTMSLPAVHRRRSSRKPRPSVVASCHNIRRFLAPGATRPWLQASPRA